MSARGILANPALYAGHGVDKQVIQTWVSFFQIPLEYIVAQGNESRSRILYDQSLLLFSEAKFKFYQCSF